MPTTPQATSKAFTQDLSNLITLIAILVLASFARVHAKDDYKLGPDSMEQTDVPKGKVTKHTWKSKVFPGTVRDYWVYVPAQYDGKTPACVMVFQDGGGYVRTPRASSACRSSSTT